MPMHEFICLGTNLQTLARKLPIKTYQNKWQSGFKFFEENKMYKLRKAWLGGHRICLPNRRYWVWIPARVLGFKSSSTLKMLFLLRLFEKKNHNVIIIFKTQNENGCNWPLHPLVLLLTELLKCCLEIRLYVHFHSFCYKMRLAFDPIIFKG
jgi:hypothetical protein